MLKKHDDRRNDILKSESSVHSYIDYNDIAHKGFHKSMKNFHKSLYWETKNAPFVVRVSHLKGQQRVVPPKTTIFVEGVNFIKKSKEIRFLKLSASG